MSVSDRSVSAHVGLVSSLAACPAVNIYRMADTRGCDF